MDNNTATTRDAIIYLPAISRVQSTDSIDAMANRLVGAFDRNARSGNAKFYLEKKPLEYFRGFSSQVYSIMREDRNKEPVADLYELDYRNVITASAKDRSPAVHLSSILLTCLTMFHRLVKGIRRGSKTSLEKWQVFYGWIMAIIVSTYLVLLAGAVISVGAEIADSFAGTEQVSSVETVENVPEGASALADSVRTNTGGSERSGEETYRWLNVILGIPYDSFVIILAGLGFVSKSDFKKMISDLGAEMASAENYLSVDKKRSNIRGQIASLLEHISEKEAEYDIRYDRIHLLTYSFGSIIAIDTLFPNDTPLVPRFRNIDTLTTIGTPYNFICTYWPDYFKNRMRYDNTPRQWINVYMKSDVFGSNFQDVHTGEAMGLEFLEDYELPDNAPKTPDVSRLFGANRSLKDYGWYNRMKLIGFRTHSQYWEGEAGTDVNSLDIVVQEIFRDRDVLLK